jgi:hypothetical protein
MELQCVTVERTTARLACGRSTAAITSRRFVLDPDGNNVEAVFHTPQPIADPG